MMSIRLKDYPVYPLYDEIVITQAHSREQVAWLVENGTLYRSIPHYTNQPMSIDRLFTTSQSTLQEIFLHGDSRHGSYYYFAEYDPEYRGDDPDPCHAIARRYPVLDTLLKTERVCNLAGCESNIAQPSWHWTHYPAALVAANGDLICYENNILYAIDGSEVRS